MDTAGLLPESEGGANQPKVRRFHNKSRLGCKNCKEKRIKCDEEHPTCGNCQRRHIDCEYDRRVDDAQADISRRTINHIRAAQKRKEPPGSVTFTFVDESESLKRRNRSSDEAAPFAPPMEHTSSSSSEDPSLPEPPMIKAVEDALEKGQQLARQLLAGRHNFDMEQNRPLGAGRSSTGRRRLEYEYSSQFDPSSGSNLSISTWQSAPSTCVQQGAKGIKVTPHECNLIQAFRSLTSSTLPNAYGQNSVNPWKALTFDVAFQNRHLYHLTLAITSAHLRHVQDNPTPSVQEVSHYVKGLSHYREALTFGHNLLASMSLTAVDLAFTMEATSQIRSFFATSTLIAIYMWASNMEDIDSCIISQTSILLGTRNIVAKIWLRSAFSLFRDSIGSSVTGLTDAIFDAVEMGSFRIQVIEDLVPQKPDGTREFDIYNQKLGWIGRENCPVLTRGGVSEIPVDIGSLHRLICIITALETANPLATPGLMLQVMQLVYMWPGVCAEEIIQGVKTKDPQIYMLLAHYYCAILKTKMMISPQVDTIIAPAAPPETLVLEDKSSLVDNGLEKMWWLSKTPRFLVRGIVDLLGPQWKSRLKWVYGVLEAAEEVERRRLDSIWEPEPEDLGFPAYR